MNRSIIAAYPMNTLVGTVLVLAAVLFWAGSSAQAQQQPPVLQLPPGNQAPQVYQPPALDPDAQRKAEQIRKEQYKSGNVGDGGNLSLDIGKFVTDPDPIERSMPDVQEDSYTGMRLRLPLRGGRE